MPFGRRALVGVHRAAVRAARLAFLRDVEEDARKSRPERRARHRLRDALILALRMAAIGLGDMAAFPFVVRGFHSDNGSEYINH